jgi:hypothetical protein
MTPRVLRYPQLGQMLLPFDSGQPRTQQASL